MRERQIEAFRAVMITGSVSSAAEALAVSQPAVSRLIALLEDKLGFALFLRRPGQPLQPTPEAEAFYVEVDRTYVALDHLWKVGKEIKSFRRGHLRVAGTPFIANSLLSLATGRFMAAFPESNISLDARPHNEVVAMVAARQQDLGLVVLPVTHSGLDARPLLEVEAYCVMPTGHALAAQRKVSLDDFVGEHFISNIFGSQLQESWDSQMQQRGIEPVRRIFVRNQEMACSLVAQGCGLFILTAPFATHIRSYPGIVFRPFRERLTAEIGILTSNLGVASRMVTRFVADLEVVARTIALAA